MKVGNKHYRSIWLEDEGHTVAVIDQTLLPFRFEIRQLTSSDEVVAAIRDMVVRGAPLIGATASCGLMLATLQDPSDTYLKQAAEQLLVARPTAVNLRWALDRMLPELLTANESDRFATARHLAENIVSVAGRAGLNTVAVITDMSQPLAPAIGNALEVEETVAYLTGVRRDPRLHEVVITLGQELLPAA